MTSFPFRPIYKSLSSARSSNGIFFYTMISASPNCDKSLWRHGRVSILPLDFHNVFRTLVRLLNRQCRIKRFNSTWRMELDRSDSGSWDSIKLSDLTPLMNETRDDCRINILLPFPLPPSSSSHPSDIINNKTFDMYRVHHVNELFDWTIAVGRIDIRLSHRNNSNNNNRFRTTMSGRNPQR